MPFKRLLPFLLPLVLFISCTQVDTFTLVLRNETNHAVILLNTLSGAIAREGPIAINNNAQASFKGDVAGAVSFLVSIDGDQYSGTTLPLALNESYLLTFRYNDSLPIPLQCWFSLSDGSDIFVDLAIIP
jgi:hypothetical protein